MNLRVLPSAHDLIDRAATATGKNRTDFVIEAASREAAAVLLDRRLFTLTGDAFEAFTAALDRSPANNPQLKHLLETPAPWDR